MKRAMIIRFRRKVNFIFLSSLLVLITVFLTSCSNKAVVEDYRSLKHAEWNQDTILVFEFSIPDPKKLYDLSFTVRNEGHYGYSNLYLFVTIAPPSGKELKDTVELTLAEPSGKWLGSGLGDLYDRKYPYKKTIFFPEIGKYTISVRQGMRTKTGILTGIHDFGIALDKAL
jgi:gliding motility-associated lipoprotein GldH